jgi:hypothetical protein
MADKSKGRPRLKAALRALKIKQSEVLDYKEDDLRVVVITSHGRKLLWKPGDRRV